MVRESPVGSNYLRGWFSAGDPFRRAILLHPEGLHSCLRRNFGGESFGRNPLVLCFLHGALWLRPAGHRRVPTWDLAIVLEGLSTAPFEPIEIVAEIVAYYISKENRRHFGSVGCPFVFRVCTWHSLSTP